MVRKKKLAEHYYEAIVESGPISYYSVMSMKRLRALSENSRNLATSVSLEGHKDSWKFIPLEEYSNFLVNSLKRVKVFGELKQTLLIRRESHNINASPIRELLKSYSMYPKSSDRELREKITLHLATVLHKGENYLKSFNVIHGGIKNWNQSINPALLKTLFPKPYISQICLLYTSPSPRDRQKSRMPSSA